MFSAHQHISLHSVHPLQWVMVKSALMYMFPQHKSRKSFYNVKIFFMYTGYHCTVQIYHPWVSFLPPWRRSAFFTASAVWPTPPSSRDILIWLGKNTLQSGNMTSVTNYGGKDRSHYSGRGRAKASKSPLHSCTKCNMQIAAVLTIYY